MSKRTKLLLLSLLLCLIGFRLYLPTLARHRVDALLNRDPLYRGWVQEVRIHLWRGAYTLVGLRMERVMEHQRIPFIAADRIDIGLAWKDLIHAALRLKMNVTNLVVNLVQEEVGGHKQLEVGRETKQGKEAEARGWKEAIARVTPFDIERLTIHGRSIHFRDLSSQPKVDLSVDHLEVQGENLTNTKKLAKSLFSTVTVDARVMESGVLHAVLHLDPLADPPQFKLSTELKGLELTQLNDFFRAYGHFDVKSGRLDAYSEMATTENEFKGYIKPIIKNLSVADFKTDVKRGGPIHAAWEAIVGAIGGIFKSHQSGHQAAKIVFQGRLDNPKTSTWDTVKSVLFNAFVKPINPGLNPTINLKNVARAPAQKRARSPERK